MPDWRVEKFGCFGKLPVSREFLVDGARELAESRFDRWIGEGLGLAKARLGSRFDTQALGLPVTRFLWSFPSGGKSLLGILGPSRDAAGRLHPFAAYGLMDGKAGTSPGTATPVQASAILETADGLRRAAGEQKTPQAVLELVRATSASPALQQGVLQREMAAYRAFLGTTRGQDLWQALESGGGPPRAQRLQLLIDTLAAMKGKNGRGFRGGIRIPLRRAAQAADGPAVQAAGGPADGAVAGVANGAANSSTHAPAGTSRAAYESAFWLDLMEHLITRVPERVWWFWSDEGERPALLVFFSDPSAAHWTCLMDPQADLESVSDLGRPYPAQSSLSASLRALLESPSSTLDEYLRWAAAAKGGQS